MWPSGCPAGIWTARPWWLRPSRPVRTPCIPGTASWPRTPASPGLCPMRAWCGSVRRRPPSRRWATSWQPRPQPQRRVCPLCRRRRILRMLARLVSRSWSRRPRAGAARACAWCPSPLSWRRLWPRPGARLWAASETRPCSWSATCPDAATSRSRSSATPTGTSSISASGSARSSAATRRSSRSPRRPRSTTSCAPRWVGPRWGWPPRSAIARRARWSCCSTTTPVSSSSWRSTPACRWNTLSPRRSPGSTWCESSCGWRQASRSDTARPTSPSRAMPSRPGSTPRTPHPASCPRWARWPLSLPRPSRPSDGTVAWTPARRSAWTTTRCWPKSSPTPRAGPRQPDAWPWPWNACTQAG